MKEGILKNKESFIKYAVFNEDISNENIKVLLKTRNWNLEGSRGEDGKNIPQIFTFPIEIYKRKNKKGKIVIQRGGIDD